MLSSLVEGKAFNNTAAENGGSVTRVTARKRTVPSGIPDGGTIPPPLVSAK
jgi:hypothetical protein